MSCFWDRRESGKLIWLSRLGGVASLKACPRVFFAASALLEQLEKAQAEGCLTEKLNEINRYKLLIIDEIGYLPFSAASSYLMFQLVSRRYENKSIVVTSNRLPGEWGLIFQDPTAATAILDRLIHHATIVTIRGDSYRATQAKKKNLRHPKHKLNED